MHPQEASLRCGNGKTAGALDLCNAVRLCAPFPGTRRSEASGNGRRPHQRLFLAARRRNGAILKNINGARSSIDAAAYLITAKDIVDALKAARQRGVRIRIVLDKNNREGTAPTMALFAKSGIGVWLDGKHKDVHDKYMLIDGRIVITGSFNFIDESEETNAENLLIIENKPKIFAAYEANFEEHLHHSDPPQ